MSGLFSQPKHIIFQILFLIVFLIPVTGCDDDDSVCRCPGPDISGVVRTPIGGPAPGATVYLGRVPEWFANAATVVFDSVAADESGRYEFDQIDPAVYQVFAGVWDRGGQGYSLVSPFSRRLTVEENSLGNQARLSLQEMDVAGTIAGEVFHEVYTNLVPADSTTVTLFRYESVNFVRTDETTTDATGEFFLGDVGTGNYTVKALKVFSPDAPFPLYMSAESKAFFCDGKTLVSLERLILRDVMVEKPAVYLYPEQPGRFQVALEFGPGIRLTASEPEYGGGWDVTVDAAGLIDGTWDYLFYEIAMRGAPRISVGWCLAWDDLTAGLEAIITDLGLVAAEKEDFLAYWRSRLPRRDYYEINPVMGADLDSWVKLEVDPAPESVLRFWLFFQGRDEAVDLPAPVIPAFERTGTTVVEWGGAVRS
ncbi:MAG: carboxypeptidase-like regulatory domain-containing protein [Candidatus Krumholzibacteriota bacterium]